MPAVRLTVICLVVTLLLAGTNELTRDKIAKQVEAAGLIQKQLIFPDGESFSKITMDPSVIQSMKDKGIIVTEVSEAKDAGGQVLGYVFVSASFGYAGNVVATTGINTDGQIVMVKATAANDTPNLGKRIEEKSFLTQFSGLGTDKLTSVGAGSGTVQIDGISGATISSRAASNAVNQAIGAYAYLLEKGVIS